MFSVKYTHYTKCEDSHDNRYSRTENTKSVITSFTRHDNSLHKQRSMLMIVIIKICNNNNYYNNNCNHGNVMPCFTLAICSNIMMTTLNTNKTIMHKLTVRIDRHQDAFKSVEDSNTGSHSDTKSHKNIISYITHVCNSLSCLSMLQI